MATQPSHDQPLEAQLADEQAYAANAQPPQEEGPPEEENFTSTRFLMFTAVPSWMVSLIVHSVIILILMFYTMTEPVKEVVDLQSPPEEKEEIEKVEEVKIEPKDVTTFEDTEPMEVTDPVETLTELVEEVPLDMAQLDADEAVLELDELSDMMAPTDEFAKSVGTQVGSGMESRSPASKSEAVKRSGGNEASEAAVARALRWIAAHQLPDGGWSFDHTIGPGSHRNSPNPGTARDARNAATAMALLPFLGAGQTHLEGQYKQVVKAGLNYLILNEKPKSGGGSFEEPGGNMYSHGLASIVLCEAYAMTKDTQLIKPAQAAVNYIVYAQDPIGGGWRYGPREPGDTSVVGWQLMALKSAHMGYLEVPPATIQKSINYLDTVGADNGAYYGYTGPARGAATTAIGLLCRMYLGWDQDHPSLRQGAEFLASTGPDVTPKANMYFNYYATQVMMHFTNGSMENPMWAKWNKEMRDFLVKEQELKGNATGSWHFDHAWGNTGGRLYNTAMSTMVLEVYYRHMPIYKNKAAEEEFKLD